MCDLFLQHNYSCLGLATLEIIYLTIQNWNHQDTFYTDVYKRREGALQVFHVAPAYKKKTKKG